jgi:hypothetical protein
VTKRSKATIGGSGAAHPTAGNPPAASASRLEARLETKRGVVFTNA